MSPEPDNLVLEILREFRREFNEFRAETRREFSDVKLRLTGVETHMSAVHLDLLRTGERLSDFDHRLARVETRLELRDSN